MLMDQSYAVKVCLSDVLAKFMLYFMNERGFLFKGLSKHALSGLSSFQSFL
jgi:hypothetical protein